MKVLVVLFALCFCAVAGNLYDTKKPWHPAPKAHAHKNTPESERAFDLTWEFWEHRKHNLNMTSRWHIPVGADECPRMSVCDDPYKRDEYNGAPLKQVRVRTYVVLQNGAWPNGLTESDLAAQQESMNIDYSQQNLEFIWEPTKIVTSRKYPNCIPVYSSSSDWIDAIDELKSENFEDPTTGINVLISCQTPGLEGTLLGMGTFPWDPTSITKTGGLWNNGAATGGDKKTLNHEFGHNLGLWHTFHGISELDGCDTVTGKRCSVFEKCTWACACSDPCTELPHKTNTRGVNENDYKGDFCSDTASTPRHWECLEPKDEVCSVNEAGWTSFGGSGYDNIMGYSGDECIDKLTPQQTARVHCYLDNALSGVLMTPEEAAAVKEARRAQLAKTASKIRGHKH